MSAPAIRRWDVPNLGVVADAGRVAMVTAPAFVQMQGGVPLWTEGWTAGAVGASADTPAHDQLLAAAFKP